MIGTVCDAVRLTRWLISLPSFDVQSDVETKAELKVKLKEMERFRDQYHDLVAELEEVFGVILARFAIYYSLRCERVWK